MHLPPCAHVLTFCLICSIMLAVLSFTMPIYSSMRGSPYRLFVYCIYPRSQTILTTFLCNRHMHSILYVQCFSTLHNNMTYMTKTNKPRIKRTFYVEYVFLLFIITMVLDSLDVIIFFFCSFHLSLWSI